MIAAGKIAMLKRLITISILSALIFWMEAGHPLPVFRLFTFLCFFLLTVYLAIPLRAGLRSGLMALASLAFGLSVLEGVAIILEPRTSEAVSHGWSVPRPVLGWGPAHAGRFHAEKRDPQTGAAIYVADYTIDANLVRKTISGEKGAAIVFFGDSYTFGVGVNDADTLPQRFADVLDHKQRIINLGFGGYGPQQFLRELETGLFDPLIGAHPRLFVFMTAVWHAERTACKPYWVRLGPHYAIENGKVLYKGPCYTGLQLWAREWLENLAFYRLFIEPYRRRMVHDDIELYVRTVVAAVQLAKEKYGVATLIPYLRSSSVVFGGTGYSDDSIIAQLREGGAYVVDASLAEKEAQGMVISIPGDGHPTPAAHRARAVMLADFIGRQMPGILDAKSSTLSQLAKE